MHDDIKLFAKHEKELESLIHAVRIYSLDIGVEFGIEKCAMLVMKSVKRHLSDGMEQSKQDKIRTLGEKETYKYLSILKVMKEKKFEKEYLWRTRKLLEIKLSGWNLIKGIKIWVVPHVRYLGPFLKWQEKNLSKWTKEQEN